MSGARRGHVACRAECSARGVVEFRARRGRKGSIRYAPCDQDLAVIQKRRRVPGPCYRHRARSGKRARGGLADR